MKREFVEHVLISMGMPVKLKGFKYIAEAVLLLDTPEWQEPKWTALYYKIARLYGDTESRVERAIRNAFTTTRTRVTNYELIDHYIGFTNCQNSNSITFLHRNIKEEFLKKQQEEKTEFIWDEEQEIQFAEVTLEELQSFNEVTADMIKEIVRKTLKEMLFELA